MISVLNNSRLTVRRTAKASCSIWYSYERDKYYIVIQLDWREVNTGKYYIMFMRDYACGDW